MHVKQRLEDWKTEKIEQTLELKGWNRDEFDEFSLFLIYPKFIVGEASNLQMPMSANTNRPNQSLLSLAKRPRKGQKILTTASVLYSWTH
jgi:hypothetical protein